MTSAALRPSPATPIATAGAVLPTILATLLFFAGWELAAQALSGTRMLVGPVAVAEYTLTNSGVLSRALGETLTNAGIGFAAGNIAAAALAMIAILLPKSERVVSGLALLVFCLPLVATGPILRVLFGAGAGPQITLAALAVYYTTYIPLIVGLRAAPAAWFDLVRSYGRGRWTALIVVRARAALPYLFAGLQIAAPAAILGAMVGEFTGAERGLGVLTIAAIRALDAEATWAVASLAAAVSILAHGLIGALARRVMDAPPPVLLAPPAAPRARPAVPSTLIVAGLALFLWWAGMAAFDLSPFFAKRPDAVFSAVFLDADAALTRRTLAQAMAQTLATTVPGYIAGLGLGAGLAMVVVLVPMAGRVAMPLAVALRSVPIITTAPLVILLLGRGGAGAISLVAIMVFFPTLIACLHGLAQAPGQIMDVLRCYRAGRWLRLAHVQMPAMLPALMAAARMAVPGSILAVTVVEWLATGRGIGSLMALSASVSDYDMLWACVVAITLVSALLYALVGLIEQHIHARYAPEQAKR